VNIDNIEKTFKDDLKDFQQKIENLNKDKGSSFRNAIQKLFEVAIVLLKLFARAISKIAALFLIMIGVAFAILLVFGLVLPVSVIGVSFPLLFELIFENSTQIFLGGVGIILLLAVPAFGLIFSGIRTLLGSKTRYRALSISLTGLWVVGLVLCIYVGSMMGRSFSVKETTKETVALNIENDTLILKPFMMIDEDNIEPQISFGSPIFFGKDEKTFSMAMQNLDVVKSESGEVELLIKKSARSFNRNNAAKKSKTVNYEVSLSNSAISFPTHFEVVTQDKYRAQNVSVSLKIPEGKIIYFSEGMEDIIYDVKNITNTFDGDMIGHYWKMTSEGLACISCIDYNDSDSQGDNKRLNYDLSGYNQIQIDGNLNVEIQQGDSYSFYIEGDNDFAKNFNAQTNGNQLTIASDFKWKNITGGSKKGTVYITTPTLTHLEINGLNNVTIKDLKTDNLNIESNGASANNFNIEVKNLTLELNGASKVIMRGSALKAVIESSGASRINASGLEINNANIDLNAASAAQVWVRENLKASLNGASKIIYKGNPKIQSQTTGGSSISREE
jgi:hypothetical protein